MPAAAGCRSEADILRALDDGTLKEASLDVFEKEPLAGDEPALDASARLRHARTPPRPPTRAISVPPMLEQMDRFERGEPLQNLVDRSAGY